MTYVLCSQMIHRIIDRVGSKSTFEGAMGAKIVKNMSSLKKSEKNMGVWMGKFPSLPPSPGSASDGRPQGFTVCDLRQQNGDASYHHGIATAAETVAALIKASAATVS